MHVVRNRSADWPHELRPVLGAVRARPRAPRPAWRLLAGLVLLGMAAWAIGIAQLPDSCRPLADWIGGLSVIAILLGWAHQNSVALACRGDLARWAEAKVEMRLIRSRRPPLPEIGGPSLRGSRRRLTVRRPPFAS